MQREKIQQFKSKIRAHYRQWGRNLPWRSTRDPYKIWVSEIMLQQTQVDRVLPKYKAFLKEFPNMRALAQASLRNVLRSWQGLGYNRRAKALHDEAKIVVQKHKGKVPQNIETLESLPGIGPYTARAIATFAYNQRHVFIETNIRTVFIHEFFKNKQDIDDKEISKKVKQTLPQRNVRDWYYALMDYGSMLKKQHGNANQRSKHYTKQSKFEGSDRQIRGKIIKALTRGNRTIESLKREINDKRFQSVLDGLISEKLVQRLNKNKIKV